MTETEWMTRREAAEYLRISTWQLDHLRLPRATLGARPRYSRQVLDDHLKQRMATPPKRTKGGPSRPPYLSPARPLTGDREERVKKLIDSWR